jgi:hypothetical protein
MLNIARIAFPLLGLVLGWQCFADRLVNVALAANGAVAVADSEYGINSADRVIDGH